MPCYFEPNPFVSGMIETTYVGSGAGLDSGQSTAIQETQSQMSSDLFSSQFDEMLDLTLSSIDRIDPDSPTEFTSTTIFGYLHRNAPEPRNPSHIGERLASGSRAMLKEINAHLQDEQEPFVGKPKRNISGATVNPNPGLQSAHVLIKILLSGTKDWRRGSQGSHGDSIARPMLTGVGHPHTLYDKYYEKALRSYRAEGHTTITVGKAYDLYADACYKSGAFKDEGEATAQLYLVMNELFFQRGYSPETELPIQHIKPRRS